MIEAALAILENEEQRNELSEIYEKNIKTFYSIALSNLHNRQDAEDAVQEAFLSVAANPNVFFNIPQEKRVSYMNVIVRNISYRIWNKKQKIKNNQTELDDRIIDESVSAEDKISSEYSCDEIYGFIDTLPEATKAAIYLKIHFDMKYSDIAGALGISEEAAKKRIARAIGKIKQFMEGKADEQKLHN